jgi:uncharacterized protein with PIN domain
VSATAAHLPYSATFRFFAELNDFLPPSAGTERSYRFDGHPSVKDAFEAQGVPHTEVDAILVDGRPVGFDYHLRDGDRVALYPVFSRLGPITLPALREPLPRPARFVCDVHLGRLARWLRRLGFDTAYRNDAADPEIAGQARLEHRIVLTRDVRLLQRRIIAHGYWVRSTAVQEQAREVVQRFQLASQVSVFSRCLACNGALHVVPKTDVLAQLEPKTRAAFDLFFQCEHCRKIFWRGSHYDRMAERLPAILGNAPLPS